MVTGQFSDSFPPIMDGVALTVSNYVSELNRTLGPAYAVTPMTPRAIRPSEAAVYRYFSLPLVARAPYRLGLPQVDLRLEAALRHLPLELVHAHSPFSAGRLAQRVARRNRIPIVATFHSKYREAFEQVTRFAPVVEQAVRRIVRFYESVDEVWVPSCAARATLREYGYRGPTHVVRNGVDLEPPPDCERLRREGSRLLGVDPVDTVLLYVGHHAWEKNTALLIRALGTLHGLGDRFRMAFVGEGYAARAMRKLAASLGLSDCTSFHGVIRDRSALSACYARADCLLFPSLYETSGLVVNEAAAFGVPSLLVRGSASTEGTVEEIDVFVAENSASAYAAKLHELLGDPERLARVGQAARRRLFRSWRTAVAEARDRYIRLVRSRGLGVMPASP